MTDGKKNHWTAERTAHPDAKANRWAIVYDPTPGGKKNEDGSTSYNLRFPALLISDYVNDPEMAARDIANALNRSALIDREDHFPDALIDAMDAFAERHAAGEIGGRGDYMTEWKRLMEAAV